MPHKKIFPAAALATKKRTFKSSWFTKAAEKRGIPDADLCKAIKEVMLGQADNLGGGVWKKRLNNNLDRSIIVAKGGDYWVFVFLYLKKDRDNIDDAEEASFKKLASQYAKMTEASLASALKLKEIVEICDEGSKNTQ